MDPSHEPQAYLNGRFLPASQLVISPVDTGFVQGAAVAEQLRTFSGRLFHLDDHLARLEHSLEIMEVDPGLGRADMARIAEELIEHNHRLLAPGDDLGLSIFVTPGLYGSYSPPQPSRPTVCLHTYPLQFRLWAAKYKAGQSLVTTDYQQVPPPCWPPALKCRSRMHYYLADRQAARIEPGARSLLLDQRGMVTEASTANVILSIVGEGLVTPPRSSVLQGISLRTVEELGRRIGIPTIERSFSPETLAAADEVLLSSTPFCLLPATRFNGRAISGGAPGAVFRCLLAAWSEMAGLDIAAQAERFATR